MKKSGVLFLVRMSVIASLLASFLLVDGFLSGALPLVGLAALLPACLVATAMLCRLLGGRTKKAARVRRQAAPRLRVVTSGRGPNRAA